MACGLEFRQPTAEIRRLWNQLRVLNDDLSKSVKAAEDYLSDLDSKVNSTKAYFVDIRKRIARVPDGEFEITEDLTQFLKMDSDGAHSHFTVMKSSATEDFKKVCRERNEWMEGTSELVEKQIRVLDAIEVILLRSPETRRLRERLQKTYQDIVIVEGEVKSLQKVLYDCEVGKAELEEDYVSLVRSYQHLITTYGDSVFKDAEEPKNEKL